MTVTHEITFATRIQQADVFFLVDNSASLKPAIDALRTSLGAIVAGVRTALPDVRFGVGSFDSMPDAPEGTTLLLPTDDGQAGRPGDYTLWLRQRLTFETSLVQTAFDNMRTISQDSGGRYLGGNSPECQVTAMYEVLTGAGTRSGGYATDAASLRSVQNARDAMGNGWVATSVPTRDCLGIDQAYGWGCFQPWRVPIIVLFSDAAWFDGPAPSSPMSNRGWRYPELDAAMRMRGAFFLGVDVSIVGTSGPTYANSVYLSRSTGSIDAMRRPVAIATASSGGLSSTATGVINGITTLIGQARQDVTARVQAEAAATGLPTGRTTADFVRAVVPVRGIPEAPGGYERRDATTFYDVLPTTQAVFRVELANDFLDVSAPRVFRVQIEARGRGNAMLDRRVLHIVVASRGGGPTP